MATTPMDAYSIGEPFYETAMFQTYRCTEARLASVFEMDSQLSGLGDRCRYPATSM